MSETPTSPLERLDPSDRADHQAAQHWVRYEWAARFLPAKRVLDCASGLGYGSALLSRQGAGSVLGVDISEEAVLAARGRYGRPGIDFMAANALELTPESIGRFDLVVSLETIEHVEDAERFLDGVRSLLEPEGHLVLSCPQDVEEESANPFHRLRIDGDRLAESLGRRFRHIHRYAQFHPIGAIVWPLDPEAGRLPPIIKPIDEPGLAGLAGFLFACANRPLPPVGPVESILLKGDGYVRELERVRDEAWSEATRLGSAWETQVALIHRLERERNDLAAESQRLAAGWDSLNRRVEELEGERDRVWEEATRLARGWEEQTSRLRAAEEENARLRAVLEARSPGTAGPPGEAP